MFNFDEIINRRNTDSFKWDFNRDPENVLPMPVADMDFKCPQPILDSLIEVAQHGVMGYSFVPDTLKNLFTQRMKDLYGWEIQNEWQVWIPGLVPGITTSYKAVGDMGDEVLTSIPVYGPFHQSPAWAGKKLITTDMILVNDRWTFDFEALEKAITPKTKVFMLCNPYNPGGTVFTREELEQLVAICQKHDIVICSDEIHCDLILEENLRHIPTASLNTAAENNTITLMAPSKTFNIAGLGCSVAIIANPDLREKFVWAKSGVFPELNRFGIQAAYAAYKDCEPWRQALVAYLKENHDILHKAINAIDGLKMNKLEATYLAWIDARGTGISNINEVLLENGLRVVDGKIFKGEGFFRVNFGCPRATLLDGIARIEKAFAS
ncbi:MalY/PatB family protein [Flectobacillus major]|uniref:MalY/PatB family protein n=1 Tax=Flectobacillus major TaxID=103 RepID=UPI000401C275|nr:PatB family C-S lyase [Flectobacillus major]